MIQIDDIRYRGRQVPVYHYGYVIMGAIASQITSLTIVYSTVYSDADQRKNQSAASLAFLRGIHRGPVNSPHKWPVTRKMFPFDDVIIIISYVCILWLPMAWRRKHQGHQKPSYWSNYQEIFPFNYKSVSKMWPIPSGSHLQVTFSNVPSV